MASTTTVRGIPEAVAAFKQLPAIMREAMLDEAIQPTASEMKRAAMSRILSSPSVQTRALYHHIDYTVNRKTGRARVGVSAGTTTFVIAGRKVRVKGLITAGKDGSARKAAGARVDNPAKRAHFIEFGTRHMPAEPFMIPAAESQKGPFLDRARRAGRRVEADMAHLGSRYL